MIMFYRKLAVHAVEGMAARFYSHNLALTSWQSRGRKEISLTTTQTKQEKRILCWFFVSVACLQTAAETPPTFVSFNTAQTKTPRTSYWTLINNTNNSLTYSKDLIRRDSWQSGCCLWYMKFTCFSTTGVSRRPARKIWPPVWLYLAREATEIHYESWPTTVIQHMYGQNNKPHNALLAFWDHDLDRLFIEG